MFQIWSTGWIIVKRHENLHFFLNLQTDQQILDDLWQILSKVHLSSSSFTWFCKPLYNSSQWAMANPQSLGEKVNSADNTVSSTGSMWQEVYTTACLAKRIIFSSRATELMLFHSHPGSAYWPVKLPCCGLQEHSVNPAYLFIPAAPQDSGLIIGSCAAVKPLPANQCLSR